MKVLLHDPATGNTTEASIIWPLGNPAPAFVTCQETPYQRVSADDKVPVYHPVWLVEAVPYVEETQVDGDPRCDWCIDHGVENCRHLGM